MAALDLAACVVDSEESSRHDVDMYITPANAYLDAAGTFISLKRHQEQVRFAHVLDLLEPIAERVDDLGTSMLLVRRALQELARLDPMGYYSFQRKIEAQDENTSGGIQKDFIEEDFQSTDEGERRINEKGGVNLAPEVSPFTGTFELLAQEWSEIECCCVVKGISSALLVAQASSTDQGASLGDQLGNLVIQARALFVGPAQLSLDFNEEVEEASLETKGEADAPEVSTCLKKIVERLDQTFNIVTSNDLMFYPNFVRALAMMGKELSEEDLLKNFTAALNIQRKHNQVVKRMGCERDVFQSSYDASNSSQKVSLDQESNLALLKKKWILRRALILQGMEEEGGEESTEGAESSSTLPPLEVSVLTPSNSAHEGLASRSTASGPVRQFGQPSLTLLSALNPHKSIVVRIKFTNEEITFQQNQLDELMKDIFRELGIPVSDQKLFAEDGRILGDNDLLTTTQRIILEQPIQRVVWRALYLDVFAGDFGKVRKHWGNICRHTREGRSTGRGLLYSTKTEPTEDFCWAEDLRKLVVGFGEEMLTEEEATVFMRECRPRTTKQLNKEGLMSSEEYSREENVRDVKPRVYFSGYYAAVSGGVI